MFTQFLQLASLTLVHITIDALGGMLPALLPVIRERFGLTLSAGVALLGMQYLVCNGMQLVTGRLREHSDRLLFVPLGLALGAIGCSYGLLPVGHGAAALAPLMLVVALSATGVAMVHPEGLRALHRLEKLPPSLATSLFMVGGYVGFAAGGWVATQLVSRLGLKGLLVLLVAPAAAIAAVYALRVRVAVETATPGAGGGTGTGTAAAASPAGDLSFWQLLALAVPVTIGATLLPSLLPTHLYELGLGLTFGGLAALVFGLGAAAGSLFWSAIVRRTQYLRFVVLALLAGVPLLWVYLWHCAGGGLTLVWLGLAAFWLGAPYPLLVTLARYARGPRLGLRMALIVGGAWGIASLVLFALGPVAERWGVRLVLDLAGVSYFLAGAAGLWLLRRRPVPTAA